MSNNHTPVPGDHRDCTDADGCKVQGKHVECCGGPRHCRECFMNEKYDESRAALSAMDFDEYGVRQPWP